MKIFRTLETSVYDEVVAAIQRSYVSRDGYTAHELKDKQALAMMNGEYQINDKLKTYLMYDSIETIDGLFLISGLMPFGLKELIAEMENGERSSYTKLLHYLNAKFHAEVTGLIQDCHYKYIERLDGLSVGFFSSYALNNDSFTNSEWWDKDDHPNHLQDRLLIDVGLHIQSRLRQAILFAEIWETGEHPSKPTIQYLLEWAKKKDFTVEWLEYANDNGLFAANVIHDENYKEPNIQIQRELVLKGWMIGESYEIGERITMQRADVWDELRKTDNVKLFRNAGRIGGGIDSTPEAFFKAAVKKGICKFSE